MKWTKEYIICIIYIIYTTNPQLYIYLFERQLKNINENSMIYEALGF